MSESGRVMLVGAGAGLPRRWQPLPVAVAALDLGVLGDALLRAPAPPGAGFALWVLAVAGTVALLARRAREPVSREAAVLLAGAALFALGVAWRDSPALKLLDMGCAAVFLALAVYGRGAAWLRGARGAGVVQYARALVAAGLSAAFGALPLATEVEWRDLAGVGGGAARRRALALLRGLLLSLPVLVVFGALLAGADAVFAQLISRTFRVDIGRVVGHVVLTAVLAWLAGGYLRELGAGPPAGTGPAVRAPALRLGIVEVGVPLALLDLLFAAFVVVQVRYLFGGADVVAATAGLTYAEYARHGFFQLVWVAALVLPLLLAAEAVLERRGPGDVWTFRGLAGTQLVLVFAIMASALQRMRLYQVAFGLTELRVYTTAFMLWLALASVWLAATVLAGRRRRFALGALVSGAATLATLNALNPDALIVRVNAARATTGAGFDDGYALRLSGDAVPALAARVAAEPTTQGCRTLRVLAKRWLAPGRADWRGWSVGSAQARATVQALRGRDGGRCPAQATTAPQATTSPPPSSPPSAAP